VAALRDLGIEAYGVDISEYAISMVRDDIKPFVSVADLSKGLSDDFPKNFDLIVNIEVLEHMKEEDSLQALRNLCQYSDRIIFSSSPDDITEETHYNVQQIEYWAKGFAKHNFTRSLVYKANYISPQAALFEKQADVQLSEIVDNYERQLRISKSKASKSEANLQSYCAMLYYDTGNGINTQESLTCHFNGRHFFYEASLPPNVKSIRFDPIEGTSCIVKNLVISTESGHSKFQNLNGYSLGDYHLFLTRDPQFLVEIQQNTFLVTVEATIYPCDNAILAGLLDEFNKVKFEQFEVMRKSKDREIEKLEKEKELLILNQEHKKTEAIMQEERMAHLEKVEATIQEERIAHLEKVEATIQEERMAHLEKMEAAIQEERNTHAQKLEEFQILKETLNKEMHELQVENDAQYRAFINSTSWRITKPLRTISRLFSRKRPSAVAQENNSSQKDKDDYTLLITHEGPLAEMLFYCTDGVIRHITHPKTFDEMELDINDVQHVEQNHLQLYIRGADIGPVVESEVDSDESTITTSEFNISSDERERQSNVSFSRKIKFSIITPLYNTPEKFLCEMIESVIGQTYSNWELCLADGSTRQHSHVEMISKNYARGDNRIIYKKLVENEGISGNTNVALEMSSGDYIALLDHDDILHPSALYEMMCAINEHNADLLYSDEAIFTDSPNDGTPMFKPDFSPDTLLSQNYMTHFSCYSRELLEKTGNYNSKFDGSQDYDMILRLCETANNIYHIPKIVYYWREHISSVARNISAKNYAISAAKNAISEYLHRKGVLGVVHDSEISGMYRIQYDIVGEPLVSIVIPSKDHVDDLRKCIESILFSSSYHYYEIVIVENNSVLPQTFSYYEILETHSKINVVTFKGEFNYPAINNFGVEHSHGDFIILLNNDTEVISAEWIQEMLMFAQREDVGAVGAKLYYLDETIQHAGVIVGVGGFAGHSHRHFPRSHSGHMGRLKIVQNLSAVTGACLMIRRDVFDEVAGLDEVFAVALNDVDLCLRLRQKGYLIVFTPFAELYHHESKSRGSEDTDEKKERFMKEIDLLRIRWANEISAGDIYYNPNLTLEREDFSLR